MANIRQIREERAVIFTAMRPMLNKLARGEKLNTTDERRSFDDLNGEIIRLDAELALATEVRGLSEAAWATMPQDPGTSDVESRGFTSFLRTGAIAPEMRAAGESSGSAGGFLVPPGWWQRLQVALKAYGGVASDFQQLPTDTGQPMQWATVNPTAIVGTLLAENTQVAEQEYTFGQGTMGAYMYSSGVQLVSFQLAQDSAFDIDSFIMARVAESLGRAQAAAAISGTGSGQPLGIVTALAAASSAGTVGSTAPIAQTGGWLNLATAATVNVFGVSGTSGTTTVSELNGNVLAPQSVLGMIKAIDPAYRDLGAKFYLNDNQLQGMRGIVDGFGRPLYVSLQGANPDLYGYPVVVDNNISNLTASAASGPIFGHLESAMVLRRVQGAGLMRLDERYADFLQVGFIGYQRIDIRSNDLRAAVVAKPSAT